MAIVNWQDVTSTFVNDSNSLLIYWGPMQAGDEGQPVSVYAYPWFSWHFTGYPEEGTVSNPNVPIMADRTVTILASNDSVCYGPLFTLEADPVGMNNRTGDPMRETNNDGHFVHIKPVIGGTTNPNGPDCGLLLFCSKEFGTR